jgi:hypothetical protein
MMPSRTAPLNVFDQILPPFPETPSQVTFDPDCLIV